MAHAGADGDDNGVKSGHPQAEHGDAAPGAMPEGQDSATETRPFKLVKFLSYSSLVVILCSNLLFVFFISNYAKKVMLTKHQEFAILLAENLNHQIYQRFTLPTLIGFGRIELRQEAQYERLEKVVQSTIYSFHVLEVRIYDIDRIVSYATDKYLVGKKDLGGEAVKSAVDEGRFSFETESRVSAWRSFFGYQLPKNSFVLRTVYPLRAERGLNLQGPTGPIVGVLQFTQDITADYMTIIYFQWLILLISVISSLVLFSLLYMIIRRADKVLAVRVAERERLEKKLRDSERLASMGRVTAGIAHEIRNPLGIIRSTSELLLKKALKENNANARLLEAIFDESKRLSRTVGDFLDYARPKQMRNEKIDLSLVLDQVFTFLGNECADKKITFAHSYPEGLFVMGDKDLLYRAFYNILANSIQAMGESGEITVQGVQGEDGISLVFRDAGPGFDLSVKDKLLDPFFTTKEMGTGLGLAIVANIAAGHGARLDLDNHPDGGAQVKLLFPK